MGEKEEKERQKEAEIAEQKKKAIEEHKRNTLRRKQEKLRAVQLGDGESGVSDDGGQSDGTLTPAASFTRGESDRSVSPNDSENALMAKGSSGSRDSSPTHPRREESADDGIMLKMKSTPKNSGNDVEETTFTEEKNWMFLN